MSGLSDTLADNAVYVVLGIVLFALFFLALNGAMQGDTAARDGAVAPNGSTDASDGAADDAANDSTGSAGSGNATANASTADADGATAEDPSLNTSAVAALLVRGIGDERNASNVSSLHWVRNGSLHDMAAYHTEDMVLKEYLATTSPGGEGLEDRFESFDPDCDVSTAAELVGRVDATGAGDDDREPDVLADAILSGWMRDHNATVLSPNVSRIAVAAMEREESRTVYVTANLC